MTSPSIAAIANAKPASPAPSAAAGIPATEPSPRLVPPDKQNLAHLTFEELSIQFLKAVKNGDLAYMDRVAQQATRSSHAPLINIRGMWESTPLIYACQYCHPQAAMWLLERGANVHMQNEKGVTPLLLASLEGMTSVVDWILTQQRASVDSTSSSSGSASTDPLNTVMPIDKQIGVVYNSAADLNIRANPLLAASMNGHVEIVAKLLAHGASVNCGVPASASSASAAKQFALLLAAKYGHARVVRLLIKHGADFATSDANGNHALLLTCEASKEECAMELLRLLPGTPLEPVEAVQDSTGSDSGNCDSGDGDHASASGPPPPSRASNAYVAAWKQPNCHGLTALHFAAANGLVPVVQTMLVRLQWGDDRAFLNATSVNRRECALLMACRKRQNEVVQSLVTCGADFELADRGGTTALQVLKREKKDELVKLCESKKQQALANSKAGDVSRVSSAVALPVRSSSNPAPESEIARAASGSERSAGASELAFSMGEAHADGAMSSSENQAEQLPVPAATPDWGGALESAVDGDSSSSTSDALAAHDSENAAVVPEPTQQSQASGADLRTMSFAPHALHPSVNLAPPVVEAEGGVGASGDAKTERIAEPVAVSDTKSTAAAVAQTGDTGGLIGSDEGGAPVHDRSSSGTCAETMTSASPAREEAYLSASKRPSKPKHRKKEQATPPRKPRQKKSVVKDDEAAGDAITAASHVDSHDEVSVVPSVTEPSSPLPDASASPSVATAASSAEAHASTSSLAPLPPPALEPSLDTSTSTTLNRSSSSTHVVIDATETNAPLKRERRKKKQKAHSMSSSSETKKKTKRTGESGERDAPLVFDDHEGDDDES